MESLLGRVGLIRPRNPPSADPRVGVLSFEIAGLISKVVRLWQSLSDAHIARLRTDALAQEGVRKLVSCDDAFLLRLAFAELLDSFCNIARSTSRLGKRCSDPVLRRLDRSLADALANGDDLQGMAYGGRAKMERKVKKMERLVSASVSLYQEMEVLAELELGLTRRMASAGNPPLGYRQRLAWQRREIRCLRDASLWNRTYDYTVRLLARSLFTIVARIREVFRRGEIVLDSDGERRPQRSASGPVPSAVYPSGSLRMPDRDSGDAWISNSEPMPRTNGGGDGRRRRSSLRAAARGSISSMPKWSAPAGPFKGCIADGDGPEVLQSCVPSTKSGVPNNSRGAAARFAVDDGTQARSSSILTDKLCASLFDTRQKLLVAAPSTLGASALALHYASLIIVIEKLAASPHLIGPDARDDLYNMLPTSIRWGLRAKLKAYAKNLSASVYDPGLASEWSDAVARILEWLAPLAHNMIRWQSERNYEQQQHLLSKTNVLLLQTLYFANQAKTESAITELLLGLNYLWRFGRELHAKAMMESMSGGSFDDHWIRKTDFFSGEVRH